MFRNRRRQDTLPTSTNATPSLFHFSSDKGFRGALADGSGKAIHMEAPVARAWKKATVQTKGTYVALLVCTLLTYFGYRHLRWNHVSVHLVCHTEECTFSITPKGWNPTKKVTFPRHQLVKVESIKVDHQGKFVAFSPRLDDFEDAPGKGKNKYKKKTLSYKGPDRHGHYPSYRLTLKEFTKIPDHKADVPQSGDSVDGAPEAKLSNEILDVPLTIMEDYMTRGEDFTLSVIIRQHGIMQSRRRAKTTTQKIDSYIKRRRHKLTINENTPPSWQGILMLVLGLFGLLLCLFLGQFMEPPPPPKKTQSGPGTRKKTPFYTGRGPSVARKGH